MALHVVGIRHHSPSCAHLVARIIRATRPRHVLIEGPADMNPRIGELFLDHQLPIAIFTHYQDNSRAHSSWTPFCRHSPEWAALEAAKEVGATPRFIDLPAWHPAFAGVRNRYSDRDRIADVTQRLATRFRFDDSDQLWDHLFEQPIDDSELAQRLATYFATLRGDQLGDERDRAREHLMRQFISWALADAGTSGDVVVVCGGWHAPAIADAEEAHPGTNPPAIPTPDPAAHCASYLVPYSFRRLDSFVGYESGLPSPAFYDAVFTLGAERAGEALLQVVAERLRARGVPVSTADLIAAVSSAEGLARLRGHSTPTRADLLDGIAAALVKDALEAPLPWTRRGLLAPATDPLLVEVIAAFSGDREGRLAPSTPRPPLIADVERLVATHDLGGTPYGRNVRFNLAEGHDRQRSCILHRLRLLGIPGNDRRGGPDWPTDTELVEEWVLTLPFARESALIEAAAWGATLETAAAARLEEQLLEAHGQLTTLARLLGQAAFASLTDIAERVIGEVAANVHHASSLADLGWAGSQLFALWRHDALLGARGSAALATVLVALFDRGLWLLEGIAGPTAPADQTEVAAVSVLRDLVRVGPPQLGIVPAHAEAVMARRAFDLDAPPAIRGAALGFLWTTGHFTGHDDPAKRDPISVAGEALRSIAQPAALGDFLAGLFALAREAVCAAPQLVAILDHTFTDLGHDEFLASLPALRLAFSYFAPIEREGIASQILRLHDHDPVAAHALIALDQPVEVVTRGIALDRAVSDRLARYGL